jgi:dynamin 1-like protein
LLYFLGPRPTVFPPEVLFEKLIKREIENLRDPSITCVENIYTEMLTILKIRVEKQHDFKRFPILAQNIISISTGLLDRYLPKAKKNVENLIGMEMSCINTLHPDFSIAEELEKKDSDENLSKNLKLEMPSMYNGDESYELPVHTIFDLFKDEMKKVKMTQNLIEKYFAIVKKTIQDMVPKCVIFSLVNPMIENLQEELLTKLDKCEENLLAEDENNVMMRENASAMLKALKLAQQTVNSVHDYK